MKKAIELTIDQARELLGKSPEIDAIIRANFTDAELSGIKRVNRWEDLPMIRGSYVSINSEIRSVDIAACGVKRNIFPTETEAIAYGRTLPMLLQLRDYYRDGWKPDWKDNCEKYIISVNGVGEVGVHISCKHAYQLSFPTREIAKAFLDDHRELLTKYFAAWEL